MVRAPCCVKMGLKKGPWTSQEDHILISHIHRHGHANWRALPKQAGLLRCGKSCRLRWTNYLRPDIKRGNFSKEEEETIIFLHEMLGNRWSTIASKLPGRTDNEIKNVWHTNLKKRLKNHQTPKDIITVPKCDPNSPIQSEPSNSNFPIHPENDFSGCSPPSPPDSSSGLSSLTEDTLATTTTKLTNDMVSKCDEMDLSEDFSQIDRIYWPEVSCDNNADMRSNFSEVANELQFQFPISVSVHTSTEFTEIDAYRAKNFWYNLFIRAEELSNVFEF